MKRLLYLLFFSVALVSHGYSNSDDVVLIAHRDVPDMDANDLKKAYLGKLHTLKLDVQVFKAKPNSLKNEYDNQH
jgi:hypothetical protein